MTMSMFTRTFPRYRLRRPSKKTQQETVLTRLRVAGNVTSNCLHEFEVHKMSVFTDLNIARYDTRRERK